ncbi:MAG: hypothetical protein IPK39_21630 [Sulfuritalea sp.]|nr:hypothetical protein [Sulfuritalea sp.]
MIEQQYGFAQHLADQSRHPGTEEVLAKLRQREVLARHLVGTPKGRFEQNRERPGTALGKGREEAAGKLLEREGEIYILAQYGGP